MNASRLLATVCLGMLVISGARMLVGECLLARGLCRVLVGECLLDGACLGMLVREGECWRECLLRLMFAGECIGKRVLGSACWGMLVAKSFGMKYKSRQQKLELFATCHDAVDPGALRSHSCPWSRCYMCWYQAWLFRHLSGWHLRASSTMRKVTEQQKTNAYASPTQFTKVEKAVQAHVLVHRLLSCRGQNGDTQAAADRSSAFALRSGKS